MVTTLADLIDDATRKLTYEIKVNGVTLTSSSQATALNELTGVPGVIGFSWDEATAQIRVNRCPNWMRAGMPVTIDAGYNNLNMRVWTGYVVALPGEDPDYLRSKVIVKGATVQVGTPPDDVPVELTATATLVGADIQPPLPDGTHIEHEISVPLVTDSDRLSAIATRELARYGGVPRRPSGEPNEQVIQCGGELYKASRAYQLDDISLEGMTDEDGINLICDLVGITKRTLVTPTDGWYTLDVGAKVSKGRPIDMLAELMQIGGLEAYHTEDGTVVFREVEFAPGPSSAWTYDVQVQASARIISATGELEVMFNPFIRKYSTGTLNIPFLNINSSRVFVRSVRHSIGPEGDRTYIDAWGGNRLGGTLQIDPIAAFTFTVEREVIGTALQLVYTCDASSSFDPDGSIASYAWACNRTTTPSSLSATQVMTFYVPTTVTTPLTLTLTVTDNDGNTHATSVDLPTDAGDFDMQIPAIFSALNNTAAVTPDGGSNWNDQSSSTCVSVDAKPADGVNSGIACFGYTDGSIKKTTDFCASALTTEKAADAADGTINEIWWDKNVTTRVWACTSTGRLYRSDNDGDDWVLHKAFAASGTSVAFNMASGTYLGDGAASHPITGLGFQPDLVWVKDASASDEAWFRSSNMPATESFSFISAGKLTTAIISLDADGFTVGSSGEVNTGGGTPRTYHWFAIKDANGLGANMKFGTYTGNGTSLPVTDVGFQPAYVWIKRDAGSGAREAYMKTADMATADSAVFAAGATVNNAITSIDAAGFTVGARLAANNSGDTFYYVAFRASDNFKTGSYSGDGTGPDAKTTTGINPDLVIVKGNSATATSQPRWRANGGGFSGTDSAGFSTSAADATDSIRSLDSGGFTIGADDDVNESGITFYWVAIDASVSVVGATYPLHRIATPYPKGVWVFGGRGDVTSTLIQYEADVGTGVWNSVAVGGDLATALVGAGSAVHVRSVASRMAGELIILLNGTVPAGSQDNIFYTANVFAAGGTGWTAATGLTAGLTDGREIVPDRAQGTFRALFADRSVWSTTNGIAFTETTNVLPAGFTPNRALWLGDYTGHSGTYLVAAQDAGATGGIYKSTDGLQTVAALRPATGFATWPASALGKAIAIGAQAGTASSGQVRLAVIAGDASPRRVRKRTGASWEGPYSATGITQASPRIRPVTPTIWFATNDSGDTDRDGDGAASRSTDAGETWSANLTDMQDVARGADGKLWAISHIAGVPTAGFTQTRVHYSPDNGDTWYTATTLGTGATPIAWRGKRIICHPSDPNKICVIGNDHGVNAGLSARATSNPTVSGNWSATNNGSGAGTSPIHVISANAGDRFGAVWLPNDRIVLVKLHQTNADPYILVSDDYGATWVSKKTETNATAGPYYVMAGMTPSGSKIVVWRRDDSGGTPASRPLVSTDSGETWDELTVDSYETATSTSTARGAEGAIYDGITDTLVVIDDNLGATTCIWALSPVTNSGTWTNITANFGTNTVNEECVAVIPRS